MAQDPVNNTIDIWILTGFLGAGKTSLLNDWLTQPLFKEATLGLIINEFGQLGVDGRQLAPGNYSTFEINKGSVFCICTRTDLLKAFQTIAMDLKPDHVIIEATGIAQPADLGALLTEPSLSRYFRIKTIACVVDAEHFVKTAAFSMPCVSQAQWADVLIINKTDLVPHSHVTQLRKILTGLNPDAQQVTTTYGALPATCLDQVTHTSRAYEDAERPPHGIVAVSLHTHHPVSRARFMDTIQRWPDHILRLKGNVAFDSGTRFVDIVCDRLEERDACPRLGQHPTSFTVIAWDIERDRITSAFEGCWDTPIA